MPAPKVVVKIIWPPTIREQISSNPNEASRLAHVETWDLKSPRNPAETEELRGAIAALAMRIMQLFELSPAPAQISQESGQASTAPSNGTAQEDEPKGSKKC